MGFEVQIFKFLDVDWDDLWDQFDEWWYLNVKKWCVGDDFYKLYVFNQWESEWIFSNWVILDICYLRCILLVYCMDFLFISIIIIFYNEVCFMLFRIICSVLNCIFMYLIWEIILVDDFSNDFDDCKQFIKLFKVKCLCNNEW